MRTKQEAADLVLTAKTRLGLTWEAIAESLGTPLAWTTAALLGQHPVPKDKAERTAEILELPADAVTALQLQPTRGALDSPVPTDPTIYRFYEVLQVYGPTIKELIHERFGDRITNPAKRRRTQAASTSGPADVAVAVAGLVMNGTA